MQRYLFENSEKDIFRFDRLEECPVKKIIFIEEGKNHYLELPVENKKLASQVAGDLGGDDYQAGRDGGRGLRFKAEVVEEISGKAIVKITGHLSNALYSLLNHGYINEETRKNIFEHKEFAEYLASGIEDKLPYRIKVISRRPSAAKSQQLLRDRFHSEKKAAEKIAESSSISLSPKKQ